MGSDAAIPVTVRGWCPGTERSLTCQHDQGNCDGCQPYLWLCIEVHGEAARELIAALNEKRGLTVVVG